MGAGARMGACLAVVAAMVAGGAVSPARAGVEGLQLGGHVKTQYLLNTYPENSFFRALTGETAQDLNLDFRLTLAFDRGPWVVRVDSQLIGFSGETIELGRDFPPQLQLLFGRLPTDERRLFDLTNVITDEDQLALLARLDRLSVGFTGDRGTIRIGRQVVSWGNGLIYTPMDFFNPFAPAAVDKEYKSGDDMVYGQLLRSNGDDLQGVLVVRRDLLTGEVEAEEGSFAVKYHGLLGAGEIDLLAAQHFGDPLAGVGGNLSVGGAVVGGDLVVTFTDDDPVASLVTDLSYSWVWGGRNVSGFLEYYYNGFGQPAGDYAPASLARNPELLRRFGRGELFTLGRHYLAASAMIEVTPLFQLIPNLFTNLADPSALLQIVTQNDLRENLVLLGALNIPMGAAGTEFGGIATTDPEVFLSTGPGVFVQLAWYF